MEYGIFFFFFFEDDGFVRVEGERKEKISCVERSGIAVKKCCKRVSEFIGILNLSKEVEVEAEVERIGCLLQWEKWNIESASSCLGDEMVDEL